MTPLPSPRVRNWLTSRPVAMAGWALGIALVTVWTFPRLQYDIGGGLDQSWGLALHMAHRNNLVFGRDIVFTYGPLGNLVQTSLAYPFQGMVAALLRLPVLAGVAWFAVWNLRRSYRLPIAFLLAVPVTWVLGTLFAPGGEIVMIPLILMAGWAVGRVSVDAPPVPQRALLALGVASGLLLLCKFDVGLEMALLTVLLCGVEAATGAVAPLIAMRRSGSVVTTTGVVTVLGWVVLGQPLGTLAAWFTRSLDVLVGYNTAMAADYHRPWSALSVLACAAAAVALLVPRLRNLPRRHGAVATAYIAAVGVLFAKQAFTRHDSGHALRAVAVCLAVAVVGVRGSEGRLADATGRRRSVLARAPFIGAGVLMVTLALAQTGTTSVGDVAFVRPKRGLEEVRALFRHARSPAQRQAYLDEARRSGPGVVRVPPSMLARIGDRNVHIEPWDVYVAWLYGLRWNPLPVFQEYTAYTAKLDALNAAGLAADTGPQAVLHQTISIDGRIPRFESPDANVELLCRFTMVEFGNDWNLFLRRNTTRCDAPRTLATVTSRLGQPVVTPPSGPGELVVARFEGVQAGAVAAVRSLVRAVPVVFRVGTDPVAHRFVVGTQSGAHIVRVPQCLQGRLGSYDTSSYDTFTLSTTRDVPPPTGAAYRVTFEALPYRCP